MNSPLSTPRPWQRIPGAISVVVPNYNHGTYLPHALAGIFAQTRKPHEVIILDDASTDHSWEIIQAWQESFPDVIKAFRNETNLGMLGNQEKGFHMAEGEYLYIHSADDLIKPRCFEIYADLLDTHQNAALAASRVCTFTDDPEDLDLGHERWTPDTGYYSPDQITGELRGRSFSSGQVMYRKVVLNEAGGFHPTLHGYCDWFWLHRSAFQYGICYSPKPLCLFRLIPGSEGQLSNTDKQRHRLICKDLLALLQEPEHRHLIGKFAASGIMAQLGDGMAELVLEDPQYWQPETLLLAEANIHNRWSKASKQQDWEAEHFEEFQAISSEVQALCSRKGFKQLALVGEPEDVSTLDADWPAQTTVTRHPLNSSLTGYLKPEEGQPGSSAESAEKKFTQNPDALLLCSKTTAQHWQQVCQHIYPSLPIINPWGDPAILPHPQMEDL